jgi:hypothetical protein
MNKFLISILSILALIFLVLMIVFEASDESNQPRDKKFISPAKDTHTGKAERTPPPPAASAEASYPVRSEFHAQNSVSNGLVAHYPFNGNANDESGNGNHGTVHGAKLTQDRFGNPNSAYYFDGKSWISVRDSRHIRFYDSFTISAWVLLEESKVNNYLRIINKHGEVTDKGGSHGSYQILTGRPNERGKIYSTLKTTKYYSGRPDLSLNMKEWHHVAVTWDGSKVRTYYDGKPVAEYAASGKIKYDDNNLYFGRDGYYNDAFFLGCIDDVKLYNTALNNTAIYKMYENE